jgi:hypothetical protein
MNKKQEEQKRRKEVTENLRARGNRDVGSRGWVACRLHVSGVCGSSASSGVDGAASTRSEADMPASIAVRKNGWKEVSWMECSDFEYKAPGGRDVGKGDGVREQVIAAAVVGIVILADVEVRAAGRAVAVVACAVVVTVGIAVEVAADTAATIADIAC